MGKTSDKAQAYVDTAKVMDWEDLDALWGKIKSGITDGWDDGKALEHLVVRGFEKSGMNAEYPYEVPPGGKPVEQIDGIVYHHGLAFLLECKDKDSNDVSVIAKMRHQLDRRPPTAFGCIFVAGTFTLPALLLTDMTPPQRILLWQLGDIEMALRDRNFMDVLVKKYRDLCRFGMTDYSPFYRMLEVT